MESKPFCAIEKAKNQILIQDVYDEKGHVLIGRNTIINEYVIDILAEYKIKEVAIYPPKDNFNSMVKFTSLLNKENILAIRDTVVRLAAGKEVDVNVLDSISNTLCVEIDNTRQMLEELLNVQDIDEYTYKHSINVAIYSLYIGKLIGLNEEKIRELCQAALLHDIGKLKVPRNILDKKGKLTEKEFNVVKRHTVDGYILSKNLSSLHEEVRQAIISHHEREDGSGYPRGIKGREINLYAKIIAIADVYDALTSERAYKNKKNPFDAIEEFYYMGIHKFSRPLLNIFFKNVSQLYVNCKVKLNDGIIGKIQFVHPKYITKPIINIGEKNISLSAYDFLKIEEIIG